MQAYEKLGVFYLGRYYDLAARTVLPDLVLYNSNDLLTHALCVGMTGSGKTGLCVDLIEEAALDGIPAILIDPKGDLANLLLSFPDLSPADFEPWVHPHEARRKGLSTVEFAAQQAELWRRGLADWDQDGARIRRLHEAAEFAVYTPGSNAGAPISILHSFAAPPAAILRDGELLRERIRTTVGSLLGLVGMQADPTTSREAVFLGGILQRAWENGRDLDLGGLIQEIQAPGVDRIGVMDVESFYPGKDRFVLATAINGLLAAPGFAAWLEGEPLDVQRLLHTPAGKPRIAIVSIAHLSDAERMFFVTLLLNEVLGWMRTQSGTTSLRALVYMDEIFGYFPPVANPPSKLPLLALLKQGRSFGLGVVLATQNPVDLDYKGLANIGTWFLGRLQTERDKQRVLDGLEGASAAQGAAFDRGAMEQTLGALGNRVFLLHNVHEEGAALFQSRWAMSYLRGPMTRDQIRVLMDTRREGTAGVSTVRSSSAPPSARLSPAAPGAARTGPATGPARRPAPAAPDTGVIPGAQASDGEAWETTPPALSPAIPQHFVPVRGGVEGTLVYRPMVIGAASLRFADARSRVDVTQPVVLLTPLTADAVPVDWAEAREVPLDPNDLERGPVGPARFAALPAAGSQARNYTVWQRNLVNALHGSRTLALFRSATYRQLSLPGESEGDFRARLNLIAREQRDAAVTKLRDKYRSKTNTLQERLRRAEQAVEREAAQAKQARISSALSFGSTLLGAFLGRRAVTAGTISKTGTALRSASRASQQAGDVARAGETAEAIRQQLADLDAQFQAEVEAVEARHDPAGETLETIELRPSKTNIAVKLVALAWTPHRLDSSGVWTPAL
ncbi:MAG: ATP-binding protein [Lentisphaeria bacterium]|nr:ATP-binding protein [Lentisphaeria bacterium]